MSQTTPTSPPVAKLSDFFTRQRANEGIELPLALPDGTPTAHWIRIRGRDSDAFKQAATDARRRAFELSEESDSVAKLTQAMVSERLNTIAALIISWSFSEECNQENILAMLKEAPQIADQIDALATKRSLFFQLGSKSSTTSPAPSSS